MHGVAEFKGFTLVELVLTLVLVGILSVSAIGLFATSDSYTARTVADRFLAQARFAQQVALARAADTVTPIGLSVTRSGNTVSLSVTTGGLPAIREINASGVVIRRKTSGTSACGGGTASNFTLQFDRRGNLNPAVNNLICIDGQQTIAICISPLGYAYEAVCDT